MKKTYNTHLKYKEIIELLAKKECTVYNIIKEIDIPIATVYRMIESLVENNIIIISYKLKNKQIGKNPIVYKLTDLKHLISS